MRCLLSISQLATKSFNWPNSLLFLEVIRKRMSSKMLFWISKFSTLQILIALKISILSSTTLVLSLSKYGSRLQKEQKYPNIRSNGGCSLAVRPLTNTEHPEVEKTRRHSNRLSKKSSIRSLIIRFSRLLIVDVALGS